MAGVPKEAIHSGEEKTLSQIRSRVYLTVNLRCTCAETSSADKLQNMEECSNAYAAIITRTSPAAGTGTVGGGTVAHSGSGSNRSSCCRLGHHNTAGFHHHGTG